MALGLLPGMVLKLVRKAPLGDPLAIEFGGRTLTLETGKLADLLVLDRNPLDNIKNTNSIRYVMKNGELYEADTLNVIWPAAKPLPKQFWWDTEPKPNQGRR